MRPSPDPTTKVLRLILRVIIFVSFTHLQNGIFQSPESDQHKPHRHGSVRSIGHAPHP
eukprot:m.357588 g.357588  ORF g.357588 m.357588 type:complete len:58 (-) comp16616_c1_seq3:2676-2849(-)